MINQPTACIALAACLVWVCILVSKVQASAQRLEDKWDVFERGSPIVATISELFYNSHGLRLRLLNKAPEEFGTQIFMLNPVLFADKYPEVQILIEPGHSKYLDIPHVAHISADTPVGQWCFRNLGTFDAISKEAYCIIGVPVFASYEKSNFSYMEKIIADGTDFIAFFWYMATHRPIFSICSIMSAFFITAFFTTWCDPCLGRLGLIDLSDQEDLEADAILFAPNGQRKKKQKKHKKGK